MSAARRSHRTAACAACVATALLMAAAPATRAAEAAASVDESLYRKDLPPVLEKKAAAAPDQAAAGEAFASAWREAGSPRVLLMWHRTLSPDVDRDRAAHVEESRRGPAMWNDMDRTLELRWKDHAASTLAFDPPPDAASFETTFTGALIARGMPLVSRAVALRTMNLEHPQASESELEMRTLLAVAPLLMELRFEPGGARATVTRLRDGVILADVLARGDEKTRAWKATDHGFEKTEKAPDRPAESQARQLAAALFQALAPVARAQAATLR